MAIELYVVAVDDEQGPLYRYSMYFNLQNPRMQQYGISPIYVPAKNIDELKVALENPQRPGLLITDGHIGNGTTWRDAITANKAQEVPLDVIVISGDPRVVEAAREEHFHAGHKVAYVYTLNKFLNTYVRNEAKRHKS